jgi:excisionase family DNA binding protein
LYHVASERGSIMNAKEQPIREYTTTELLSVSEAAALLGIHRPHVYRLTQRGDLAHVRIGGHRFIPLPSVREYIDRKRGVSARH